MGGGRRGNGPTWGRGRVGIPGKRERERNKGCVICIHVCTYAVCVRFSDPVGEGGGEGEGGRDEGEEVWW